jgi:hypothetical protein
MTPEDVLAYPHQIGDALWRVEAAGIPGGRGRVSVCGVDYGAEALAEAIVAGRADPPPADDDPLVLCASYSGDDEEALECFEDAGRRGARRAVICTAGALAARAREEGGPVIGVPAGIDDPRAAIVYFTLAAVYCADPSLRSELERASAALEGVTEEEAEKLAAEFRTGTPMLQGEPAVVRRWAEQVEAVTGIEPDATRRLDLDSLAHGETRADRILSLVMLGDLVAAQLA